MLAAADDLGLGTLVEAHTADDLERALATSAKVVGVNARDLETLEVDVERGLALVGVSRRTASRSPRAASRSATWSAPPPRAPARCWSVRR